MKTTSRVEKLRSHLENQQIDAMLISSPENRRYLSGFAGSAGYLLVTEKEQVLATDFRYIEQAEQQAPGYRIERITASAAWLPQLALNAGITRIGFEANNVSIATHSTFLKAIQDDLESSNLELIATNEVIDRMRAIKDKDELELIEKAIMVTDQAFEDVSTSIKPGITEKRVAWELEKSMREQGAEGLAFDIIVGAGINGALPHHLADDTPILSGQSVVIDMGAKYQGYCADLTRTIFVGDLDEQFETVYSTVLSAQLEAEEKVSPGMTGGEVDAISRDIISEAGYGDHFGHSLGHGVGLAVHEHPRVGPKADNRIEDGMVFTIEPGIYLTDWGGVRIEDIVVMEGGSARVLSNATKIQIAS